MGSYQSFKGWLLGMKDSFILGTKGFQGLKGWVNKRHQPLNYTAKERSAFQCLKRFMLLTISEC